MFSRVCVCLAVLGALAAAPAAAGDGPLFASQGGSGVLAPVWRLPGGPVRLVPVTLSTVDATSLEAISTKDGSVVTTLDLAGQWGLPYTPAGTEGISRDGTTLVLSDLTTGGYSSPSNFLVVNPRMLRVRFPVTLHGYFSYDALSPDGKRLYLIQYTQGKYGDLSHYIVRAYDLRTQTLLPGRIADRTQKSWVMDGSPVTRTTSGDGRWVYTLYMNPGGYPFIHALDTVRGVAHCVGLPIDNQNGMYNLVLSLHGRTLAVHWRSGRPYLDVDTATWRVTAAHGGGFPWPWTAIALVPVAALGALLLRRRRRGEELEQELADLLRVPEREVVV